MCTDTKRSDLSRVEERTADPSESEETVENEEESRSGELLRPATGRQKSTKLAKVKRETYEMIMKDMDMPAAVNINIFRRPTLSIKSKERHEHIAYSVPTQAASKWLVSLLKWKELAMIVFAYVATMLIPEICCALCIKNPRRTRRKVCVFPPSKSSL